MDLLEKGCYLVYGLNVMIFNVNFYFDYAFARTIINGIVAYGRVEWAKTFQHLSMVLATKKVYL